ncbi:uncharacterized protein LOC101898779 [Musca domestica]|uniref:Uncharacterized protein LOC101898779 n=1 Tax=Musca domestica TaxID=7370 RepID=A0A1I8MIV1_MUSDO|nr:uncharacterized protein LOC101898779 [Musca domestica]
MSVKIICSVAIVIALLEVVLACNGYKAKILKAENCAGPDGVITLDPDFSVKLNKKCEIVPTGCVNNKAFSTANSKYKIVKDGMTVAEGTFDMCGMADQAPDQARQYMNMFGVPSSCPVEDNKICSNDNKVDLSQYKSMLSLARGNIVIDSEIEHDTGKSCFHVEIQISKS